MAIINGTIFNDDNTFNGGSFRPSLIGTVAGDVINGLAGNDILEGKTGNDFLYGGLGDDIYFLTDVFTSGSGLTQTRSYDTVNENAGEGIDSVKIASGANPLLRSYSLSTNIENGIIDGTSNFNLSGNFLNNRLTGNLANNILSGLAGNDFINGRFGNDQLIGGGGNDTYILGDVYVSGSGLTQTRSYDTVIENAGEGIDSVRINSDANPLLRSYLLSANIENGIVTGASNFDLTGNALNNRLTGNSANNWLQGFGGGDILNGGLGDDILTGGTGDDVYILADTTDHEGSPEYDRAIENAGEGIDGVEVSSDTEQTVYYLEGNIEWGVITGTTSSFTLIGNESGNTLHGNDQTDDELIGAGNMRGNDSDVLFGYGGNDTLYASSNGRDVMYGGLGYDTFFFNDIDPLSFGSEGSDAIMDFDTSFKDIIDLSAIDAKASITGNNSFTFIGSAPFTAEGQISATQVGADTILSLNTSGTADAEMQILLSTNNSALLSGGHFFL